jgi:hypothetical protein
MEQMHNFHGITENALSKYTETKTTSSQQNTGKTDLVEACSQEESKKKKIPAGDSSKQANAKRVVHMHTYIWQ